MYVVTSGGGRIQDSIGIVGCHSRCNLQSRWKYPRQEISVNHNNDDSCTTGTSHWSIFTTSLTLVGRASIGGTGKNLCHSAGRYFTYSRVPSRRIDDIDRLC